MARPRYREWRCEACGERASKRWLPEEDAAPLPAGWEDDRHVRCADCIEAQRSPAPVTISYLPGSHGLSRDARRTAVRERLIVNPEHADGWIAAEIGVDGDMVSRLRASLESDGTIPRLAVLIRRNGARQRRPRHER